MTRELYIKDRRLPGGPCPNCGKNLDAATGIAGDREGLIPTIGAPTVCCYCGVILQFAEQGYHFAPQSVLDQMPPLIRSAIEFAAKRRLFVISQERLEHELSDLAARFREKGRLHSVIAEYGACLTKLFHIPGYSGEPDADSQLPIECMPQIYRDHWNKKGRSDG